MSSAASNPSSSAAKPMMLKRNSEDIGWDYGVLVDPNNLNVIKCKLCGQVVSSRIYRLKLHIAGIRGQVNMLSTILLIKHITAHSLLLDYR
jgi:hypothetical protein